MKTNLNRYESNYRHVRGQIAQQYSGALVSESCRYWAFSMVDFSYTANWRETLPSIPRYGQYFQNIMLCRVVSTVQGILQQSVCGMWPMATFCFVHGHISVKRIICSGQPRPIRRASYEKCFAGPYCTMFESNYAPCLPAMYRIMIVLMILTYLCTYCATLRFVSYQVCHYTPHYNPSPRQPGV